ncbi:possible ATP-dependent DNA ligase [Prochlorococcus marinus str. MIT 9515]|uniref:DNA ligase (ATP) n=1 Tax=Prochlorococcus marinus (strain MIT 9515) TaxID=167542 RepID=A2BWA5_PROM5|nr:ATP-dependent DNA ligase [Prochlorococcus marinus]ABM72066.1 possible ATP-dependent DNA ligase [Prochlorococcus marinus str. MIT 9515]
MSLKKFSELYLDLDSCNSTNKKIEILNNYFSSNEDLENAWTIYLLTGKKNKRFISGSLLKTLFSEIYEYPLWLIDSCYLKVGDSSEVISLLLRNKIIGRNYKYQNISLNELLNKFLPDLYILKEEDKKLRLKEIWENIPKENHLVINKILTGTFRVGVSIGLITKSIAKLINLEEAIISHRLMGDFIPSPETYQLLISKKINPSELNYKPYPFLLANTFDKKIIDKSINDFQFEWKWDGIRIQLIKRDGKISIWSRGQELVNKSFPELVEKIVFIKDDFVVDGELLVWNSIEDLPMNFSLLQKRLNRKEPSRKIQKSFPITFIAYDLLEIDGEDQREFNLKNRRINLENNFYKWLNESEEDLSNIFKISKLIYPKNWKEAEMFKNNSRDNGTEGLVIKNKNSNYSPGRKKGLWWKYKVDPMQLDAVLIYAKGGTGIRAGLYTDYSFGLWKDGELIKFASAYSGLNNTEIKELDKWIRQNTIERFGPVRSVKPKMVFEISFENIQRSKRHKSGIAVRFPRITKWRKDKFIQDADTLENAQKLILSE